MGGGSSKGKREATEAEAEQIDQLQQLALQTGGLLQQSQLEREELEAATELLAGQTNQSMHGIAERDEMILTLEKVATRLGKNLERAGGVISDLQMKNQRLMKHMTVNQLKMLMKERRITLTGSTSIGGAMFVQVDGQTTLLEKMKAKKVPATQSNEKLQQAVEILKEENEALKEERGALKKDKGALEDENNSLLKEREALLLQMEVLRDDCGVMKILRDRVGELKVIAKEQHEQLMLQDEKLESQKVTESFRSLAVKLNYTDETRPPEAVSVGALKNHLSMELAKASGWKRSPW